MGLSETRVRSTARRDRLLLIAAIAIAILTVLGAAGEKLGMDKYLKANTVKHRTLSLFRQGCYYYGKLPRMELEDRVKLLHCFSDLLLEHSLLKDIIWVL